MKKIRKGFTLVELLIVIAVIGILASMAMVGGSEANNIATANKIVEEFKIIGAAMNMYYADNRGTCDGTADADLPAKIKTGLTAYMKNTDAILDAAAASNVGKYLITVVNGEWWLTYTLPKADTKVTQILANKATAEGLMKKTTAAKTGSGATGFDPAEDYDKDSEIVCYQVR